MRQEMCGSHGQPRSIFNAPDGAIFYLPVLKTICPPVLPYPLPIRNRIPSFGEGTTRQCCRQNACQHPGTIRTVDAFSTVIGLIIGTILGASIAIFVRRGAGEAGPLRQERDTLRTERDAERSERSKAERELATLTERESQLNARFEEQRAAIEEMRTHLVETFDASSRKALQDNSERFIQQAADRMKPLKEQLDKQEKLVSELAKERQKGFGEISETLKHVLESHRLLSAETSKLTTALRRPDQRGRWGEVQLRRVVELAGMTEHCDFAEQASVHSEDGISRPDLTVFLPGGGQIVVDSKARVCEPMNKIYFLLHFQEISDRFRISSLP